MHLLTIVAVGLFLVSTAISLYQRYIVPYHETWDAKKALSSGGYKIEGAKFHPRKNEVTWNLGATIARLYYFPMPKWDYPLSTATGRWGIYHINDQGERLLVSTAKLDDWLDEQRLESTKVRDRLVASKFD